jgi:catechol 2,3-dioxygenase-like lactoylglutathione lyase family enzyme
MAIERMDHVGIVVHDLAAAVDFFVALGLGRDGEGTVGGDWVDRVVGLEGVESEIAMLRTPDGHGCVELVEFSSPPAEDGGAPPSNATGLRHITFAVDDLDAVLARLAPHGGELVGTVETYEDIYRLCYVRGPAGIIVELAERIGE